MLLAGRSRAEACWYAEEIRRTVRGTPDLPPWTVSLGLAAVEPGDRDFSEAIERADRSLYRAKAEGATAPPLDPGAGPDARPP